MYINHTIVRFSWVLGITAFFVFPSISLADFTGDLYLDSYSPAFATINAGSMITVDYTFHIDYSGDPPTMGGGCRLGGTGITTTSGPQHDGDGPFPGSITVGPINSDTTLTLECLETNAASSASGSVAVSVAPPPNYTLTTSVSPAGGGTVSAPGISCPGDCSQDFTYGEWVTIIATPADGYSFGAWTDACAGQTTTSCSVLMDGDKNTGVDFSALPPPTVSLNTNPNPVSYNTGSNLSWSSTNATSCTASDAWSGSKELSGDQSTGNLISNQTYTLTCTGLGGSASRSVTVSVLSNNAMSVLCTADPTTALLGQNVTWTANISGGTPPYTYSWSGTNIPTTPPPSTNPYTRSYSTIGQKTAMVTVTGDDSVQAIANLFLYGNTSEIVDAIENGSPRDEITVIEQGGARYPQAVDTAPMRRVNISLRWFVQGAYAKAFGKKKKMCETLAEEIIKASEASMESYAFSKKNEAEKQADGAR